MPAISRKKLGVLKKQEKNRFNEGILSRRAELLNSGII